MQPLRFQDIGGNNLSYTLLHPGNSPHWQFEHFLEFMALSGTEAQDEGFVFEPEDSLWHERFRLLVNQPELTLNPPLEIIQNGIQVGKGDSFSLADLEPIEILREPGTSPDFNPSHLSLANRHRAIFKNHHPTLTPAVDQTVNGRLPKGHPPLSFAELFDSNTDPSTLLPFLLHAARAIHAAPFENWSKFSENVPFRNGYEMWVNLGQGAGGVCSEKTAAFKFLCDILHVPVQPVIGTHLKLGEPEVETIGEYFLSNGQSPVPCDIKHLLLEAQIGDEKYLVDVTGGTVPLLFLNASDAQPFFEAGYPMRMVSRMDKLFLTRVPAWIGDAHLLICEYHLADAHYDLVFDQDLGLEISPEHYIAAFFDYGGDSSTQIRNHFRQLSSSQRLEPPLFITENEPAPVYAGRNIRFFADARERIIETYPDPNYTGDIGVVIQPLKNNFWRQPMLSGELQPLLEEPLPA